MLAADGQPDLIRRHPEKVIAGVEPRSLLPEPNSIISRWWSGPCCRHGWSRTKMPVARYFMFVGGVLLALLFAIDAFLPKEPVLTTTAAAATVENPTLRIRSDRKWPERIVYDTSLPTIVPPPSVKIAAAALPPAPVAEISPK